MATAKRPTKQPLRPPVEAAAEFDEERIPFDDVMRTLLKAKPQHKVTAKPAKKAPAKKK